MSEDFWDAAFGGKDTLRLSLGAHSFRNRVNKTSVTYSFVYGDGNRIRVRLRSLQSPWFSIEFSDGTCKRRDLVFGLQFARPHLENLTGLSLDPFTHG